MRHIKAMTTEAPAKAEQAAYVTKKDIFWPTENLTPAQAQWVLFAIDEWLQK